jgi:hypothetical protein
MSKESTPGGSETRKPELSQADRKAIKVASNNFSDYNNAKDFAAGAEWGILHAQTDCGKLLNEQGRIMQQRIAELEAEVARLKEDVFKANDLRQAMEQDCIDCDRIEAERDKLKAELESLKAVQSSVQSPEPIVFDESGAFGDPQQMSWEISKLRNEVKILNEALKVVLKMSQDTQHPDADYLLEEIEVVAKAAIAKASKEEL